MHVELEFDHAEADVHRLEERPISRFALAQGDLVSMALHGSSGAFGDVLDERQFVRPPGAHGVVIGEQDGDQTTPLDHWNIDERAGAAVL